MKGVAEIESGKRAPVRVLVADASAVVRTAVKRMLESDEGVQVIGAAQDGEEALEKAAVLNPDVIALDIGASHTGRGRGFRELMRRCRWPVVILSETNSEAVEETLQALDEGAFDYAPKQCTGGPREMARLRYELVSKVKAATRAGRQRLHTEHAPSRPSFEYVDSAPTARVICIGSSTGGPRALQQILPRLPADLPASVLVVQHMPHDFTGPFARRLDSLCPMEVREARNEDTIEPGVILIAPAGWHMTACRQNASTSTVRLSKSPEDLLHRPSVDVLMMSATEVFADGCMGIILTGMGADGARGMKAIYERGGMTVGQDEASCAVYGMPRACAELGVLHRTVALCGISEEILSATRYRRVPVGKRWAAGKSPAARLLSLNSSRRSAHEVQDQRNDRHNQQDVNQTAGHVEHAPAENPANQQDNEQNCENTHRITSDSAFKSSKAKAARGLLSKQQKVWSSRGQHSRGGAHLIRQDFLKRELTLE